MIKQFAFILSLFLLFSCTENREESVEKSVKTDKSNNHKVQQQDTSKEEVESIKKNDSSQEKDTIKDSGLFTIGGFQDKKYYELLIETHLCNPKLNDSVANSSTPCSSRFFKFFPYNHNRRIEDAFMLQVRAGVNNYPYRRLLIFVREKGKLVLMNGIVGYLVERISQNSGVDDLIVAVFDDLGNNNFDRYDVLLKYKDGKYHFVEAIGDLEGEFKSKKLKEAASKAIKERIDEKQLIF